MAIAFLPKKLHGKQVQAGAVLLAGPGMDGIMVTWKDNFDSFYSEVAELGRYEVQPRMPSERVECREDIPESARIKAKPRYLAGSWKLCVLHLNRNSHCL